MSERDNMNLTPEELRIQASLRGLGEVRADDAFREKLRQQFVSGELVVSGEDVAAEQTDESATPVRTGRSRRPWVYAALPAIAAVLIVVILSRPAPDWQLADVRGTGTVTVNGHTADAADPAAVAELIAPEARIAVPAGVQVDFVLGKVMVVGIAGPADFTLPANPAEGSYAYQATVHDGEFRIKTGVTGFCLAAGDGIRMADITICLG